jgi:hypothetical protein
VDQERASIALRLPPAARQTWGDLQMLKKTWVATLLVVAVTFAPVIAQATEMNEKPMHHHMMHTRMMKNQMMMHHHHMMHHDDKMKKPM